MATLTDSLLNGVKSLFSGLGAKTTDSNYAVPLVNKSSAEPAGFMGISELVNYVYESPELKSYRKYSSVGASNYAHYFKIDASGWRVMDITVTLYSTCDIIKIAFVPGDARFSATSIFGKTNQACKIYAKAGSLIIAKNKQNTQMGLTVVASVSVTITRSLGVPDTSGYTEMSIE